MKNTKNEFVKVTVSTITNGLQFDFNTDNPAEIEKIKSYLNEYIEFAKNAVIKQIPASKIIKDIESEQLAKIHLEAQISHLQLNLKLKDVEIKYLSKDNNFLKDLALKLADNSKIGVTNQIITDGQQQFASTIKNLDKNED